MTETPQTPRGDAESERRELAARLAREYLAEWPISPLDALTIDDALEAGAVEDTARLASDEAERLNDLRSYYAAITYAILRGVLHPDASIVLAAQYAEHRPRVEQTIAQFLARSDAAAVLASSQELGFAWVATHIMKPSGLWPEIDAVLDEAQALMDRARVSGADLLTYLAPLRRTPDGREAPAFTQWLADRGLGDDWTLHHEIRGALRRISVDQAERLRAEALAEADRHRRLYEELERRQEAEKRRARGPLRISTRTAKIYTTRKEDQQRILKSLRGRLSAADFAKAASSVVPLSGDEMLVVAVLLDIAKARGELRSFGPARARVGAVRFEARLLVPHPSVDELARRALCVGNGGGRPSGEQRQRVALAIKSMCDQKRPIFSEYRAFDPETKKWGTEHSVAFAAPIEAENIEGTPYLALHGSLALGYWWGHITLEPERWEPARLAVGARYCDDQMKWADVYFRRLTIGVVNEYMRAERKKRRRLHEGQKNQYGDQTAKGTRPEPVGLEDLPERLEKELAVAGLLKQLELTEAREKNGPKYMRGRLAKILDFCVAVGVLLTWEWVGTAPLPSKVRVWLPRPEAQVPHDVRDVQVEIFPALTAGDGDLQEEPDAEPDDEE